MTAPQEVTSVASTVGRRGRLIDLATLCISLASLTIALMIYVRSRQTSMPDASEGSRVIANWPAVWRVGHAEGALQPLTRIVVFEDYQCPFCAALSPTIKKVLAAHRDLAVVYRNYPLMGVHPYALTAAIAAECASQQGRFLQFRDSLYSHQNLIGTRSWTDFAREVGVRDLSGFDKCMVEDGAARKRVAIDVAAARTLKLSGTPSVIVGGTLLSGTPSEEELLAAFKDAR